MGACFLGKYGTLVAKVLGIGFVDYKRFVGVFYFTQRNRFVSAIKKQVNLCSRFGRAPFGNVTPTVGGGRWADS